MGTFVLVNARTELSISSNARMSREAFSAADAAARVATFLCRIVMHPELGEPEEALSAAGPGPTYPLTVEINEDRFTADNLEMEAADFDYAERYLEAGGSEADLPEPHILFKIGNRTVAAAVVNMVAASPVSPGRSLSVADRYDSGNGASVEVNLVVTVSGGSMTPYRAGGEAEPKAIVTAIYRELM
jgi:hypothetical protein